MFWSPQLTQLKLPSSHSRLNNSIHTHIPSNANIFNAQFHVSDLPKVDRKNVDWKRCMQPSIDQVRLALPALIKFKRERQVFPVFLGFSQFTRIWLSHRWIPIPLTRLTMTQSMPPASTTSSVSLPPLIAKVISVDFDNPRIVIMILSSAGTSEEPSCLCDPGFLIRVFPGVPSWRNPAENTVLVSKETLDESRALSNWGLCGMKQKRKIYPRGPWVFLLFQFSFTP